MTLPAGTHLGPYEILAPLGAGGMGEVYRARDPRLSREVAIKVLPSSFSSDADRLRRFEQEAKAAGVLNHPNITAVYDVGSWDGSPYVVQELLEGETLRAVLAGGKLSPRRALDYALQVARGLAAAHEKGIVHRDLKPENLFVTKDGRVKILDFGLAKLTRQDTGAPASNLPTETRGTEPGVVLGTLGYMSPEQVRGREADARSDIFAFGAILYEMLSGHRAFRGDSAADTMSAILREDPPDLSLTNQSVSPGLERVVRHCLEKTPEQRFHSAHDVAFALEAADALSGGAPRIAAPKRTRFAIRRVLGIVALLAAGAALGFLARRAASSGESSPLQTGTLTPLTTDPGYEAEPTFSPDGETIAYVSDRDGNDEIYLQQISGGPAINLTKSPAADIQPSFSPDGRQIAFVSTRESGFDVFVASPGMPLVGGDIWVMPALGGPARRVAQNGNFPSWSPDGRSIVFSRGTYRQSFLSLVPTEGGAASDVKVEDPPTTRYFYPSFSSDGRWILFQAAADVGIVAASGGKARILVQGHAPAWGPGSKSLLFTSREAGTNGTLWEAPFSLERGELAGPPRPITFGRGDDMGASVSKDGRSIVFASLDVSLNLEEISLDDAAGRATGTPREITRGSNQIGFFDPSPDGRSIVFAADRGGSSHVWRIDPPAAPVQLTLDERYEDGGPRWSPDGRSIAFGRSARADSKATEAPWLMAPDGSNPRRLTDAASIYGNPTWLDERRLLCLRGGEEVVVVDAQTGAATPLPGMKARIRTLFAVDAAGTWLVYQTPERGNMDIAAVPLSGGTPRLVVATERGDYHPFFSPTGRWLYFQEDHKNIYRVPGPAQSWKSAKPERVTDFPEAGLYLEDPRIARDGTKLFYTRGRTTGDLWLLRRGERRASEAAR